MPAASISQDIQYFTKLGIIGGASGLSPLLSIPYDIPTADDTYDDGNTTITYQGGMVSAISSAGTNTGCHLIWNFPAAQDKAFILGYISTEAGACSIGITNTTTAADLIPGYSYNFYGGERSRFYEVTGVTVTSVATNDTITMNAGAWYPVKGIALYADAPGDVQYVWMKNANTSNWERVFNTTDASHTASTWLGMDWRMTGASSAQSIPLVGPIFAFGEAT